MVPGLKGPGISDRSRFQPTISRVQIAPAVLGNPDRGHIEVPELVRTLNAEEARTTTPAKRPVALQEPLLAHHTLDPLPVDLAPSFWLVKAATIRVPSVGFAWATSTISRLT